MVYNTFERMLLANEAKQIAQQEFKLATLQDINLNYKLDLSTFSSYFPVSSSSFQRVSPELFPHENEYDMHGCDETTDLEDFFQNTQSVHVEYLENHHIIEVKQGGNPIVESIDFWIDYFIDIQKDLKSSLFGMVIYSGDLVLNIGHPILAYQIIQKKQYLEKIPFKCLIYTDSIFIGSVGEDESRILIDKLLMAFFEKDSYQPTYKINTTEQINKCYKEIYFNQETSSFEQISLNHPEILKERTHITSTQSLLIPTSLYYKNVLIPHYGVTLCSIPDILSASPEFIGRNLTPFLSGNLESISDTPAKICTGTDYTADLNDLLRVSRVNSHSRYHAFIYGRGASSFKNVCLETSATIYKEYFQNKETINENR